MRTSYILCFRGLTGMLCLAFFLKVEFHTSRVFLTPPVTRPSLPTCLLGRKFNTHGENARASSSYMTDLHVFAAI